jgi:hypothetical protein
MLFIRRTKKVSPEGFDIEPTSQWQHTQPSPRMRDEATAMLWPTYAPLSSAAPVSGLVSSGASSPTRDTMTDMSMIPSPTSHTPLTLAAVPKRRNEPYLEVPSPSESGPSSSALLRPLELHSEMAAYQKQLQDDRRENISGTVEPPPSYDSLVQNVQAM